MEVVNQLKAILKEAELYRSQGLLQDSQDKYLQARELVGTHPVLSKQQHLLDGIDQKMQGNAEKMNAIRQATETPTVSETAQDLIKKLFAFPAEPSEDSAALEGAIALAKFGQFERAISEFQALLPNDATRVVAAKNIVKCHLAQKSPAALMAQYDLWLQDPAFGADQLEKLRLFANNAMKKEGIDQTIESPTLSAVMMDEPLVEEPEGEEEEVLDISSVGITFPRGPLAGTHMELNVSFQSSNIISILISSSQKDLLDSLPTGTQLKEVQYFSPIAMFTGNGVVSAKSVIKSGPRTGDYNVDIKVVST